MTGKVAVITGASEGIGAGLVAGYRARGWAVVARPQRCCPAASDRIVSTNLVRAAAVTPRLAGNRYGG